MVVTRRKVDAKALTARLLRTREGEGGGEQILSFASIFIKVIMQDWTLHEQRDIRIA